MKAKSILIITATLLIGFVIGFLVNGRLTQQKFQRFVSQDHFDAFKFRMMDAIKPDINQVKDIVPILDEYAEKVHLTMEESKSDINILHENMIKDLSPYLDEHQLERLEEVHKRFNSMMREKRGQQRFHRGDRPGPGPGPGYRRN